MLRFLRRFLRTLAAVAAALVIVAAIFLGGFRFFAASLPSYKDDLQAWVSESLNIDVQYEGIDLRLGLSGPELAFFDAALFTSDSDQPFVLARRASVVIDPMALIFERQLAPTRLVFEGIEITVQRSAEGSYRIAGAPQSGGLAPGSRLDIPEEVSVSVRDSEVVYVDEGLGISWPFSDVRADIEQEFRAISVSLSAEPPAELADRVTVTADGITSAEAQLSDDWRIFVALRNANLGAIAEVWPQASVSAGSGDISLWLQADDGEIVSALADLALEDVVIPFDGEPQTYGRVEFIGELADEADGWSAVLSDVNVVGPSGAWPRLTTTSLRWQPEARSIEIRSDYLVLDDLLPVVAALPASDARERYLALQPRGRLEDLHVRIADLTWSDFEIAGRFDGLGISNWAGFQWLDGFSGELRADAGGGTLELASPALSLRNSQLLDRTLDVQNVNGFVQWREGRDATRVLSDELTLDWLGAQVSLSGELELPHDAGSPVLELDSHVARLSVADALPFVVAAPMDARVRDWLASALGQGTLVRTDIEFYGPLRAFPFDAGEGEFVSRSIVRGGVLDYAPGWPRAEGFDGILQFRNASLSASGRARVLGNVSDDVLVRIADMRTPVLTVDANTQGPLGDVLAFLLTAPPIAEYLGPDYERLRAPAGTARVRLDLDIPLPETQRYTLSADLVVDDGTLALEGFGPQATEISGALSLADGRVSGRGIKGTFLEGPAAIEVDTPETAGYRTLLNFSGEVSADAVVEAFDLPWGEHVAGQTRWEGLVMLPELSRSAEAPAQPTVVEIRSNLSGIALRLPAPFRKSPADATNLGLRLGFGSGGQLEITANLGANRHFSGVWSNDGEQLEFVNGVLAFGARPEHAAPHEGLAIVGELPAVDLDEWIALRGSPSIGKAGPPVAGADLQFADLRLWNQAFGAATVDLDRKNDSFDLEIDSAVVAGRVDVPYALSSGQISAQLQYLHLQPGEAAETNHLDPRDWPGFVVDIDDFRIGMRSLGSVHARVDSDPLGLRLVSFSSSSPSVTAEGSGAWLVDGGATTSRVALSINSSDVAAALADFDLDPVLSGSEAELTASLSWPGGPSSSWMDHISGDVSLRIADGSMLDIEPGAGRLVGLMSVVALPRRLALDFRDVFNKGFVFDEISADFAIVDGNAFTDNLKLTGPAAEIGVAGRTGLRDKDLRQQAVVTAEPGNMLPTVGAVIAGPGVGAALLIFTRIFKEPLKGIGRASYCITGSWDDPVVERLTAEQLEAEELCADLPDGWTGADGEESDT